MVPSLPVNATVTAADVTAVSESAMSAASAEELSLHFGREELIFVRARARRLLAEGVLSLDELTASPTGPARDATVVIPARNEAPTIGAVVRAVRTWCAEVIVVEGGSIDATAARAAAAGARVVRDPGLGKGAAMRLAVEHVTTPFCVFVDADGSHDPIDIPSLLAPLRAGAAELVTGSRMLGGSDELHGGLDEFVRLTGSSFITWLINLRYGVRISDSQNGFRAIRTDLFRRLGLRSRHITMEMEMIMAALASGARIQEIPTHEKRRAVGYSKVALSSLGFWASCVWVLMRGLSRRRTNRPPISREVAA
jgi:dolichol-phosphate hexosyltransferase